MPIPSLSNESPITKINDLSREISTLQSKISKLEQFLDEYRPRNIVVQDISGKLKIYQALSKEAGAYSDFLSGSPFEIKDASEKEGEHKAQIFYDAYIKTNINDASKFLTIKNFTNKFDVRNGDYFYIEITFTPQSDDDPTAELKCESSLWSSFPEVVELNNDGDQTKAFIAVAKIVPNDYEAQGGWEMYGNAIGEKLMATQYLRSSLVLINCCLDGTPVQYPFPDGASPVIQ